MQEGTMSQTFLDVFESDTLCSTLVEQQPAYIHYPIAKQRSLNQRPAHEGHNMLSGEVRAIQQARDAKNEKKNKKERDNSIGHTSDLGSKARASKEKYRKEEKEQLASQENKNKTNKAKKKDDDTKEKLDKSNKSKKKDDDKKQLVRNRDYFMKSLFARNKDSTVPKPPIPANKERVQVEKKACTPHDKKKPIVKTTPIEKKTPIHKKKVSFDEAITPPCAVVVKKMPQKLKPQKQNFRIPKMEVKQAASDKDVWRLGKMSTPSPQPVDLESPGTSSSESTIDKKDLKSYQESLKNLCEAEIYDPKVVLNLKKEAVEELEQQQSEIEREEQTKQYDNMLIDKNKKKEKIIYS